MIRRILSVVGSCLHLLEEVSLLFSKLYFVIFYFSEWIYQGGEQSASQIEVSFLHWFLVCTLKPKIHYFYLCSSAYMFLYIFFYCWEFHTFIYWILVKYSYFFLINCYSVLAPFFFSNFTCSLFFKSIEFIYWCLYMHDCETICGSTGSLPGTSYLQVSSEKWLPSQKSQ